MVFGEEKIHSFLQYFQKKGIFMSQTLMLKFLTKQLQDLRRSCERIKDIMNAKFRMHHP